MMMKTFFFVFLTLLLFALSSIQGSKSAFCMLTVNPPLETLEFMEQLAQDAIHYGVDVYILIDAQNYTFSSINSSWHFRVLNIPIQQCVSHGYQQTTHKGDKQFNVGAWDKALLYFTVLNKNYSYVWFTENDVFIPSTQTVRILHQLYANDSDLVTATTSLNLDGNSTFWQWSEARGKLVPPWSNSMVNYIGISSRLLQALYEYILWRGKSTFHEFFFLTIAIENNMKIITPTELSTIKHRQHISWDEVYKKPNNIWHPMKDPHQRKFLRQRLAEENLRRTSIDYVNDFHRLREDIDNMSIAVEDLQAIMPKFEISKGLLSPHDRHFMREYFVNLSEQYRKERDSEQAVALALELADHAYKQPEAPVTLTAPKTSYHLKLEQNLLQNKRAIFKALSAKQDKHILENLRTQATRIIREITSEVQKVALAKQEKEGRETAHIFFFSSTGYKHKVTYKSNPFQTVLCVQLMPCISIFVLIFMIRKIAKFHSK